MGSCASTRQTALRTKIGNGWHVEVPLPSMDLSWRSATKSHNQHSRCAGATSSDLTLIQTSGRTRSGCSAHLDGNKGPSRAIASERGQVVALDGNNGSAKNPHVHVGALSWQQAPANSIGTWQRRAGFRRWLTRSNSLAAEVSIARECPYPANLGHIDS